DGGQEEEDEGAGGEDHPARTIGRRTAPLQPRTAGPPRPRLSPGMDDKHIAVIGQGYVGLPLALALAEAGREVIGVDASAARVRELRDGHSPIDDVGDARLAEGLKAGRYTVAGTDEADLASVSVLFVCVPTPLTD